MIFFALSLSYLPSFRTSVHCLPFTPTSSCLYIPSPWSCILSLSFYASQLHIFHPFPIRHRRTSPLSTCTCGVLVMVLTFLFYSIRSESFHFLQKSHIDSITNHRIFFFFLVLISLKTSLL